MYQSNILVAIVLYTIPIVTLAQVQELVTDRPDQSNAPALIPTGALQVESGFLVEKKQYEQSKVMDYSFINLLIKLGVNENFEAHVSLSYRGIDSIGEVAHTRRGFSPITLGAKIKLAEAKGVWPQAAILGHVSLRSPSGEFKSSHTGADLTIALSRNVSRDLDLVCNLGVKWDGDGVIPVWTYSVSIPYQLTKQAGIFIECYGFYPEYDAWDHRIDGGLTFKIQPLLQLDLSGGWGLCSKSPDYFLSAGLSFRLFK